MYSYIIYFNVIIIHYILKYNREYIVIYDTLYTIVWLHMYI
jgi:hypothetical protein